MQKYFLHGHLKARTGLGSQLTAILLEASQLVSPAKGCILYVVGKDHSVPDSVWVTEIWDSKEDHDNSLSMPGVRELISKAIPLMDGMPQKGQELEIVGGKGLS